VNWKFAVIEIKLNNFSKKNAADRNQLGRADPNGTAQKQSSVGQEADFEPDMQGRPVGVY
jgi:hypothetical protein